MMWMLSIMDGNIIEGKWLAIEHKALKWTKANNAPPKGSLWWMWHHLHDYGDYKTRETQMHKMHKQRGWVVWCLHMLQTFLKFDPS
jgi:hypothetical protein